MQTLVKLNVEKSTIEKLQAVTKTVTATKATRIAIAEYPKIYAELEEAKELIAVLKEDIQVLIKYR